MEHAVGFTFAVIVATREWWRWYVPRRDHKRELRAECERAGHRWGEPFTAMGSCIRNCERCKRQEHRLPDGRWPE